MDQAKTTAGVLTAISRATGNNKISHSNRNGLFCALVLAACVLMVYPVANMPFGDDFSYTKTAMDFAHTGHFLYNGWATAILGWQILWGALFIKIFGFSFTVLRLSMLPIAMASVYLFHEILRRFEINSANAVLGALAMALTPLFLPMASTYMTDIPGVFVIIVCLYMCQRTLQARTDRIALAWLISATLVNVAGGTVRQIAWLGALVMVPSTAWLLRQRRGMKSAGIALWIMTLIGVLVCMHWFNRQPYSVPEPIYQGPVHSRMLVHLAAELLRTFFCLLLVVFPVSAAWLPMARRLTGAARLRFVGGMAVLAALAIVLCKIGRADTWLMPWLVALLETQPLAGTTTWIRAIASLLVIAPALIILENVTHRKKTSDSFEGQHSSWHKLFWILGPFTLSYVVLLAPLGTYAFLQDRYVLGLIPTAVVILLKLYQEQITARLSAVSLATLTVFAIYAVAGAHSLFAGCRALVRTVQMVESSGVPRMSIQAGMASDGWAQIAGGGHINDARIKVPVGAYDPNTPRLKLPDECTLWFYTRTPAITPKYFLEFPHMPCFAPTKYPPIRYTTWLPPFHRAIYIQQLKQNSN